MRLYNSNLYHLKLKAQRPSLFLQNWSLKHDRFISQIIRLHTTQTREKRFNNIHIITDKDQIDWIHPFVLLQEIISPKNVSLNVIFVILPFLWGKYIRKKCCIAPHMYTRLLKHKFLHRLFRDDVGTVYFWCRVHTNIKRTIFSMALRIWWVETVGKVFCYLRF